MTNPNDNVQWYDYTHGFRMYFPNGYGLSIIPGHNGDTMEVMVVNGDGAALDVENQVEYCTPSFLGDYISKVRDLPARTGCFPLAPNETIQG
jgi:hypothetical protein